MKRCLECKHCKAFDKNSKYEGQHYCSDCGEGISENDLNNVENDCESFFEK